MTGGQYEFQGETLYGDGRQVEDEMTKAGFYCEIRMYRAPGEMVLHTWHTSEVSRDIELLAVRSRIKKGELSHAEVITFGKTEMIYQ